MSEYVEIQTNCPYNCELCDSTKNVEWRCVECAQNLCNYCKRSHLRSNASSGHYVVTLFEGLLHAKYAVDATCVDHAPERLASYCVTCETPVCPKCMVSNHVRHYFMDIVEKSEEISNEFSERLKAERNIASEVQQRAAEALMQVKNYCSGIRALEATVNGNADALKGRIDTIRNAMLQEIRGREMEETEPLSLYANELKSQSKELMVCLNQLEKRRRFNKGAGLIKLYREAEQLIPKLTVPAATPPIQLPVFVTGCQGNNEIERLFGQVLYPEVPVSFAIGASEDDDDTLSASDGKSDDNQ